MAEPRRGLLWGAAAALSLGLVGGAIAARAELPAERKAELRHLLEQDCGSCHGLTRKGGLGSPLTPENMANLSDEAAIGIILDGIPDTPMPPWRGLLDREDAAYLVRLLRKEPDDHDR